MVVTLLWGNLVLKMFIALDSLISHIGIYLDYYYLHLALFIAAYI